MYASSKLDYESYFALRRDAGVGAGRIDTSQTWKGREVDPSQSHPCRVSNITVQAPDIFAKFQAAKAFCIDVDSEKLRFAAVEAARILSSGIFSDFLKPNVSVDTYGEFSISLRRPGGYLDIGVCGDGELSFHVRNDFDASKTVYGDVEWDGATLPDELIEAAIQLSAQ